MRLGQTELLLIFGLAVLFFGGSRISGLGKSLGKSIREFKQELNVGGKAEVAGEGAHGESDK